MSPIRFLIAPLCLVTAALAAPALAGPTTSSFGSTLEGWTAGPDTSVQHQDTGGNGGGFLLATDDGDTLEMSLSAPAQFHGDLRPYNGGMLYFDAQTFPAGEADTCHVEYGSIAIIASGSLLSLDMADLCPPVDAWQRFAVPLRADVWGYGNETLFDDLLANVTTIGIRIEALDDVEKQGVDNFTLTDCPWDLDGNGSTGFNDLVALLANWGPCDHCQSDFDGDGTVAFSDLIEMLAQWGGCP